jgi:putative ABC transport system permease protein
VAVHALLSLLLKNLRRNKLRTAVTATAIVVLVAVSTMLGTVIIAVDEAVESLSSDTRLMVREKWTSPSRFPVRCVPRIAALEGVEDWTTWHYYGGHLDDGGRLGYGIATRTDNLLDMTPGMGGLEPALIQSMSQEKSGALMGRWIMDQMGWRVGQEVAMASFTHPGKTLQFKILGILPSEMWSRHFFFREDYYQDSVNNKETVNLLWLRATDAETAEWLAGRVETLFDNGPTQLRVETESAGVARDLDRLKAVVGITVAVTAILLFDMVIIMANSINMSVRERRREMAIMRVLGIQPGMMFALIVGEAVTIGALSGMAGAGLAYAVSALNAAGQLPVTMSFLNEFEIRPQFLLYGFLIGALVAFIGSAVPAWLTQRVRVAEIFSRTE